MAFGKLKVKARCKKGRGAVDAAAVIDAVMNTWGNLQEAINAMGAEDQQELREHFNNLIEGEDDLGDALFGTADDFDSRLKFLDDDCQQQFTDELIAQEVIDKAELEAE